MVVLVVFVFIVFLGAGATVKKAGLTNALIMVVTLQASGNLVNSYIDHNYGVDTVETAGDRCDVTEPVRQPWP